MPQARPFLRVLALAAALPCATSLAQTGPVRYHVDLRDAASQVVRVSMRLDGVGAAPLDVHLPVWRPGLYLVLDPAGSIRTLSCDHPIEKTAKSTWRVSPASPGSVTVSYEVWAASLDNRTRHADDTHAFLNPSTVFMYADAWRGLPVEVRVTLPERSEGWRAATGLAASRDAAGFLLTAPDYDRLADSPIEIGAHGRKTFEARDTPHEIILWTGDHRAPDLDPAPAPAPDLFRSPLFEKTPEHFAAIVEHTAAIFGSLPYDRYVFLIHCYPGASGGTEHWNSTIMQTPPEAFLDEERHRSFLSLVAHEFFHTWNVKRFRPAGLAPYDYQRENYTDLLWVAEGSTTYYENVVLTRAGLMKPADYLKGLAESIDSLRRRPGNAVQSVADSSFDAWIKHNRRTADAANSTVSFYEKGALVSFLLDMEIRRRTGNAASLDTVMRTLFERFPTPAKGYSTADLRHILRDAAGDFDDFFATAVNGTADLDFESALRVAGLTLHREKDGELRADAGLTVSDSGGLTGITSVAAGGPAHRAGLIPGDVIAALNGRRVTPANWDKAIERLAPGDLVRVEFFRRDLLREAEFALSSRPKGKLLIKPAPDAPADARAVYEHWLGQPWPVAPDAPPPDPAPAE